MSYLLFTVAIYKSLVSGTSGTKIANTRKINMGELDFSAVIFFGNLRLEIPGKLFKQTIKVIVHIQV